MSVPGSAKVNFSLILRISKTQTVCEVLSSWIRAHYLLWCRRRANNIDCVEIENLLTLATIHISILRLLSVLHHLFLSHFILNCQIRLNNWACHRSLHFLIGNLTFRQISLSELLLTSFDLINARNLVRKFGVFLTLSETQSFVLLDTWHLAIETLVVNGINWLISSEVISVAFIERLVCSSSVSSSAWNTGIYLRSCLHKWSINTKSTARLIIRLWWQLGSSRHIFGICTEQVFFCCI